METTPHDGPARQAASSGLVGQGIDEVRDRLESLGGDAAAFIRARPVTALGIAFAAGWLIGRLLR